VVGGAVPEARLVAFAPLLVALAPLAAVLVTLAALRLPVAHDMLPPGLGTLGLVPAGTPLHPARAHPARAMMTAPARTALAGPCLLMYLPRSGGVTLATRH
jgi:hypothetical protein